MRQQLVSVTQQVERTVLVDLHRAHGKPSPEPVERSAHRARTADGAAGDAQAVVERTAQPHRSRRNLDRPSAGEDIIGAKLKLSADDLEARRLGHVESAVLSQTVLQDQLAGGNPQFALVVQADGTLETHRAVGGGLLDQSVVLDVKELAADARGGEEEVGSGPNGPFAAG